MSESAASPTSAPLAGPLDPRAAALEVEVAQERTREAMFGRSRVQHVVGRYLLMAPIGRGGMGMVFAAYDPQLDRRVAIKLVRPLTTDPSQAEVLRGRMIAEARAMAKVSHPNVVTVYEADAAADDDSLVYLAMELVDGVTLRRWVAERPRSWREIVEVHVAAGRGLAAVHRAGLVHRDFKGDNAMIDREGRVRVMDFGLARDLDGSALATADGGATAHATRPSGTPGYMAPEQLGGAAVDHRVDQYALCVALYEALWAKRPYQGDALRPLEPPRTNVPARVRAAILRGLAEDRDERFPTMDALLDALQPRRRGRSLALGLGAATIVGVALAFAAMRSSPCRDDGGAVDELTSPATVAAIERAFAATDVSYADDAARRSNAGLGIYAQSWADERRRACEATRIEGSQSESRMDRRMRCLERRRHEALAVVRELAAADAEVVDNATAVIERLTPAQRCDDDAFLDAASEPPTDPELALEVEALDAELDRVDAARELGRWADAVASAEDMLVRARATGFAPIIARAEVAKAISLWYAGDIEAARAQLRPAYFAARRSHEPEAAARVALELASLRAGGDGEVEDARLWLELGRSEIAAFDLGHLEPDALSVAANIAHFAGEWEESIALTEQRIAVLEATCPDGCDELGSAHREICQNLGALGRHPEALAHARSAFEYEVRQHDPDHPHVAWARTSVGETLVEIGRQDEGIAELSHALASQEARYGADNFDVLGIRAALGQALAENGRTEEGIAQLEQAVKRAAQQPLSPTFTLAQHMLGRAYHAAGRLDDAATAYRAALATSNAQVPEGDAGAAATLGELANLERDRGNYDEAIAGYLQALEIRRNAIRRSAIEGPDPMQGIMLSNIGNSYVQSGRPAKALPYYEQAAEITAEGDITVVGVHVRLRLADLYHPHDRAAAAAWIEDAQRRCDALSPELLLPGAECELLDRWREEHAD